MSDSYLVMHNVTVFDMVMHHNNVDRKRDEVFQLDYRIIGKILKNNL